MLKSDFPLYHHQYIKEYQAKLPNYNIIEGDFKVVIPAKVREEREKKDAELLFQQTRELNLQVAQARSITKNLHQMAQETQKMNIPRKLID